MSVHPPNILSKEEIYHQFGLNPSDKIESDYIRDELIKEMEKQRQLTANNRKSLRSEYSKTSENSYIAQNSHSDSENNNQEYKDSDHSEKNENGSEENYYDPEEYQDEEKNSKYSSPSKKNEEPRENIDKIQRSEIKAYDSDPEYGHYQKGERKSKKSAFSLQNSPKSVSFHFENLSSASKLAQTKKYTIPEPFSFENRTLNGGLSITKKRFLEDMEIKRLEEKKLFSHQFRAKPIPEAVLQRDLYKKLMTKNEERRVMVKKNSIALTLQNERPFSFYLRDKNKATKKNVQERKQYKLKNKELFSENEAKNEFIEEEKSEDPSNPFNFKFKAKPVPWFCSISLYKEIISQEKAAREERITAHAQELMAKSKLPPRMEKHEQKKKLEESRKFELKYSKFPDQIQNSADHFEELEGNPEEVKKIKKSECNLNFTFHPVTKTKIPDFSRMHASFQNLLEANRQNKRNTVIKPFNFQQPRFKKNANNFVDNENFNNFKKLWSKENRNNFEDKKVGKTNPLEKWQKIKSKTQGMPSSTKKWEEATEKRRREKEKKEREEKEKEFGGKAKKEEKISELKARLLGSSVILEYNMRLEERKDKNSKKNKKELLQQKKVEDDQKQKWKDFMEELKNKPLLVETYNEKNLKKKRRLEELKKARNASQPTKKMHAREKKEEDLAKLKEQKKEYKTLEKKEDEIEEENEYENEKFEDA